MTPLQRLIRDFLTLLFLLGQFHDSPNHVTTTLLEGFNGLLARGLSLVHDRGNVSFGSLTVSWYISGTDLVGINYSIRENE